SSASVPRHYSLKRGNVRLPTTRFTRFFRSRRLPGRSDLGYVERRTSRDTANARCRRRPRLTAFSTACGAGPRTRGDGLNATDWEARGMRHVLRRLLFATATDTKEALT